MKNKKTKLILICILSAVLLPILFVWGHDIWRHHALSTDYGIAVTDMEEVIDQPFSDKSGCAFYPEKFVLVGKGEKKCFLETSVSITVENVDKANEIFTQLSLAMPNTSITYQRPVEKHSDGGVMDGSKGLLHKPTKKHCYIYARTEALIRNEIELKFEFTCDDTSWFARNFQRNNSIFTLW